MALALGFHALQSGRAANAIGGAVLQPPLADCSLSGAQVQLTWIPMGDASSQWIEYSIHDNGFAAGTFITIPLEPAQATTNLTPLLSDWPNFWRVMSETPSGLIAPDTGRFVPCGGPILLWGPLECRSQTTASVDFRWAPLASATGEQWIEIDNDGDFTGGDVDRIGPLAPSQAGFRRGGFMVGTTYFFRVLRIETDGSQLTTQVGGFSPDCYQPPPVINPDLYSSDARLFMPRLGIEAPVNVRDVGYDGKLGDPIGGYDVVRYNFGAFPELDSRIGEFGTTLIGGHVDYYVIGRAIFWNLRDSQPGDVIEYNDGQRTLRYVVDWVKDIPFAESLNPYLHHSNGEALMLVTCIGTFDRVARIYDLRRLVHAVPAPVE
jgi:hypothetical protein